MSQFPQSEESITHEFRIAGSAAPDFWWRLESLLLVQAGLTIVRDGEDITLQTTELGVAGAMVTHRDFRDVAPHIGARPQDGTRNWTAMWRAHGIQQAGEAKGGSAPAPEFSLEYFPLPHVDVDAKPELGFDDVQLSFDSLRRYVEAFDRVSADHNEKAATSQFCPSGAGMGPGVVGFCRKFVVYKLAEINPPDA